MNLIADYGGKVHWNNYLFVFLEHILLNVKIIDNLGKFTNFLTILFPREIIDI